jgi:hypothetical protein
MKAEEYKKEMDNRLSGVCEFIKEAFSVDGDVTTDGKECIILNRDGSRLTGVTFTATDSERGTFMVTLSNPEPMDEDRVEKDIKNE